MNIATAPENKIMRPVIEPRRVKLDFSSIKDIAFFRNNAVISAYWVGLSAIFPVGETEFINSVLLFKDEIEDQTLRQQVKDFTAQEAHHALQHKQINKQFKSIGYVTDKVHQATQREIQRRCESWSREKRLRRTVSAEHFTAVMAHFALTNSDLLDELPTPLRDLFMWHAIEEIEHKSVAFDVYKTCVGDMGKLRRHYLFFALYEFPLTMILVTRSLLKSVGHRATWQERKAMWQFLFGKGGMISSVKHLYWQFVKRGFSPWQHDNSALVETWKKQLSPMFISS